MQLRDLIDDPHEDDIPTIVPELDIAAFARARARSVPDCGGPPASGIRPSFPTLTTEVGALPSEPEEDTIVRCFGCSARILLSRATNDVRFRERLEPRQAYVLGLLDGAPICDVLDTSRLSRFETLCALEELVTLEIIG